MSNIAFIHAAHRRHDRRVDPYRCNGTTIKRRRCTNGGKYKDNILWYCRVHRWGDWPPAQEDTK